MTPNAVVRAVSVSDPLASADAILRQEAAAIVQLADRLNGRFLETLRLMASCCGHVAVTGMGKAGLVGRKISATFASTGTPSIFLHPAEALHGDLGRIRSDDVLLALSHRGETTEVVQVAHHLRLRGHAIVAMTSAPHSSLARLANVVLDLGDVPEAGSLKLAPTTSVMSMLALGDALALVLSDQRGLTPAEFARHHPGGSLGLQLSPVEQIMRPLEQCRVGSMWEITRDVVVRTSRPGRRTGAIMLVDDAGRLAGIFTDSDLARMIERRCDAMALDQPIHQVMTGKPRHAVQGTLFQDALEMLRSQKISELPVVDREGHPLGMIDITDVVGWFPAAEQESMLQDEDPGEGSLPATIPFPGGTGHRI